VFSRKDICGYGLSLCKKLDIRSTARTTVTIIVNFPACKVLVQKPLPFISEFLDFYTTISHLIHLKGFTFITPFLMVTLYHSRGSTEDHFTAGT
jgi:hypothetical protein